MGCTTPRPPASLTAATSSGFEHGYIGPQMSGTSTWAWRVSGVSMGIARRYRTRQPNAKWKRRHMPSVGMCRLAMSTKAEGPPGNARWPFVVRCRLEAIRLATGRPVFQRALVRRTLARFEPALGLLSLDKG